MKIVLVQNTLPVLSGAGKSNQVILESLAEREHACHLVAPAVTAKEGPATTEEVLEKWGGSGAAVDTADGAARLQHQGVVLHVVYDFFQLPAYLQQLLATEQPDWVLVSAEEPSATLLQSALAARPSRVVALAQTALYLPFGPGSFTQDSYKTRLLQQTACVLTFSQYMKQYVEERGKTRAAVLPYMTYGSGPFPRLGRFDNDFVTIINPCALKGIDIFLALARRFPDVAFAAVLTWGATEADHQILRQRPNVTLLAPSPNVDDIFARTRILLVSSLSL
jgi:hypothetical protein